MSIRAFGLALLVAAAFVPVLGMASEVIDVRLDSLSMEGERGEMLTVGRKDHRLSQLRLETDGKVWLLPSGALDISFQPDIAATRFDHYDQRGKAGYRVTFTGQFVEGNKYQSGQLAFEFLDGRLIAREIWENTGSGYELTKSEPF